MTVKGLPDAEVFLTTKQVAEMYGIPVGTLKYYRHANAGPASFQMGRRICYRRSSVEKWIAAQEAVSTRGGIA